MDATSKSPAYDGGTHHLGVLHNDARLAWERGPEERALGPHVAPHRGDPRLVAVVREEGAGVGDGGCRRGGDEAQLPRDGEVLDPRRDGDGRRTEAEHRPVQRGGEAHQCLGRLAVTRRHGWAVLAWVSPQHGESAMTPTRPVQVCGVVRMGMVRTRVRAGDNSGAPPVLRINHTGGAFEVSGFA